jgi:hypothetical protein
VEELDWSAGEILAALRRLNLDEKTLVIFTADNGAVKRNPPQGSNAPYRGSGYDTSEGAMRMPCVMRWPGHIPAGKTQDALCSTMDLLPTFANPAGATLPANPIDGHDIRPLVLNADEKTSPWDQEGFYYYDMEQLQAVRSGPWKVYLPLKEKLVSLEHKTAPAKLELYNVRDDKGEIHEVSAEYPDVVVRLRSLAEQARSEIGDMTIAGKGQRAGARSKSRNRFCPTSGRDSPLRGANRALGLWRVISRSSAPSRASSGSDELRMSLLLYGIEDYACVPLRGFGLPQSIWSMSRPCPTPYEHTVHDQPSPLHRHHGSRCYRRATRRIFRSDRCGNGGFDPRGERETGGARLAIDTSAGGRG